MTTATETTGSSAQRERRRRILDATLELANEGGFDAVQMRAVADNADVALGTLYRYFPSKIHLLVTALGREFDRVHEQSRSRQVPGDTAHERVMHILGVTTRAMQKQPQLTEALTRAFMFADASVADEIHDVGMKLTAIITHAIAGTDQMESPPRRTRRSSGSSVTCGSPRSWAGSPGAPRPTRSPGRWTSPFGCCCASSSGTARESDAARTGRAPTPRRRDEADGDHHPRDRRHRRDP